MTVEPMPSVLDTAVALGIVAALSAVAALRHGWLQRLRRWLGYGNDQ